MPAFLIMTVYRSLTAAMIGPVMCSMFLGAAYSVGAVAAMTLFPTGLRFTAFAVPLGIGTTLFGSTTPYVSTWLTATTGNPLAPGWFLAAAAAAATVAAVVGIPRRAAGADTRPGRGGDATLTSQT